MKRILRYSLMLAVAATAGLHAATLTLQPAGGALNGSPGQTVGWGFSLANPTNYLLVTAANYVTATPIGTFTDFASGFNFIVVGPAPENPVVAQPFDLLLQTGIGAYLIDPGTPVGALSTGVVRLTYDLYSVSPNDPAFDPAKDLMSSGNFLDANASVQVQAQTAGTPEPSTCLLLGSGLLAVAAVWRRRQSIPRS
jgi:hypothetical protein